MRRIFLIGGFVLFLCSCENNGSSKTAMDSPATGAVTDTNNASKNTGTDMSGGVNAGNLNSGDTTGIDIKTNKDSASGGTRQRQ
jgi:hypothetical protein